MFSSVPATIDESNDASSLNVEYNGDQGSHENVISKNLTGSVKWFNSRSGYGFITVCGDSEYAGNDIFVHYTSINVSESQYKYLFQGEYVEFTLIKSTNSNHEFHAINVTGICGGPIMCETRRSVVPLRTHIQTNDYGDANHSHEHNHHTTPRFSGGRGAGGGRGYGGGRGESSGRGSGGGRGTSGGSSKYDKSVTRERTNEENTDGFSAVVSKKTKRLMSG
jgi:CspA family cold shock protein